jgi:hypothetical protein
MKRNIKIKSFTCLLAPAIVLVVFSSSRCLADVWIDPGDTLSDLLTWTDSAGSEIIAEGDWKSNDTTFEWIVSRDSDPSKPLTYTYTFTAPIGSTNLSHFDLQVSEDKTDEGLLPVFSLTEPLDFININGYDLGVPPEVEPIYAGSGQIGPWMVGDLIGIRFQDMFDETASSWTVSFKSYRLPMWGYWFVKGGTEELAYNSMYGETLVPDSSYVPVPGAVLLGLLGLGVAGITLRKFA